MSASSCYGCQRSNFAENDDDKYRCSSCGAIWCEDCAAEGAIFKYGAHIHCNACRNPKKPEVPTRTLLEHLLTKFDWTYGDAVRDFRRKNPKYAKSAYLWTCTKEHDDCIPECKTLTKDRWGLEGEVLGVKGLCCKIKSPGAEHWWCSACKPKKRVRSDDDDEDDKN